MRAVRPKSVPLRFVTSVGDRVIQLKNKKKLDLRGCAFVKYFIYFRVFELCHVSVPKVYIYIYIYVSRTNRSAV